MLPATVLLLRRGAFHSAAAAAVATEAAAASSGAAASVAVTASIPAASAAPRCFGSLLLLLRGPLFLGGPIGAEQLWREFVFIGGIGLFCCCSFSGFAVAGSGDQGRRVASNERQVRRGSREEALVFRVEGLELRVEYSRADALTPATANESTQKRQQQQQFC